MTGKQVQLLLGMVNYLRPFMVNMATMAALLDALQFAIVITNEDWTSGCEDAINSLKHMIALAPVLHVPRWDEPFFVATNASNVGVSAVLFQGSRDEPRYITMASRSLSKSERNYSATKKELRGIIVALDKFRYFVSGCRFTLFTDHAALQYIFTQPKLTPMLENWVDKLLELPFDVVHIPGIVNVLPDCLSRLYPMPMDGSSAYDDFKTRFDVLSSTVRVDASLGGGGLDEHSFEEQIRQYVVALAKEGGDDELAAEEDDGALEPVAMEPDRVATLLAESIIWDNKSTQQTWQEAKEMEEMLEKLEERGSRSDFSLAAELEEPLDWSVGASGALAKALADESFSLIP